MLSHTLHVERRSDEDGTEWWIEHDDDCPTESVGEGAWSYEHHTCHIAYLVDFGGDSTLGFEPDFLDDGVYPIKLEREFRPATPWSGEEEWYYIVLDYESPC